VAIGLAIWTKQVILSLFLGVWIGATMLAHGNPWVGVVDSFRHFLVPNLADSWNASVIVMLVVLGGFAALIERGGGAHAFAKAMRERITSPRSAQTVTWLGGLAIFFSDSTNPVVVGPIFRPITDRVRVSREKLAYIVDSTSAAVPCLLPITSWGAYIMGLIGTEFQEANITESVFLAFTRSIPFQLYTIAAILMVLVIAATNLEYGPMRLAEMRARREGKLLRDGAEPLRDEIEVKIPVGARPTVWNMFLPIICLVICIFGMFLWTGGFPGRGFFEAFPHASTMPSLIMSFFVAGVVAFIMGVKSGVFTFKTGIRNWMEGVRGMMDAMVILVLAWGIGSVCKGVGTAPYIVGIAEGVLSPHLLYLLIFLAAAATAFSTGTSWGTFAIFMPIAIPLALALDVSIYPAIGAALSGGIFGDHSSPVSDTTILSSIGSTCDHIDHVTTQLPYALTAALAAGVGYIVAGFAPSGPLALIITLAVLAGAILAISKATGRPLLLEEKPGSSTGD
jgi:Na+/H+ antiporter NhaC